MCFFARFLNGQKEKKPRVQGHNLYHTGFLGGYTFYDHLVCSSLNPIGEIVEATRRVLSSHLFRPQHSAAKVFIVTSSFPNGAKIFVVDSESGRVLVKTLSVMVNNGDNEDDSDDTALIVAGPSLLEWLEIYYSKLQVRNLESLGRGNPIRY